MIQAGGKKTGFKFIWKCFLCESMYTSKPRDVQRHLRGTGSFLEVEVCVRRGHAAV
jgi:hypothetical protein